MKKVYRFFPICLLIVSALLLTSCSSTSSKPKKSDLDLLNDKIIAIDTGVDGFSDIANVCSTFNEVFDSLNALDSTKGVYIDQLKNKCTGFYNTYLILTEEADEAIGVVGSIFTTETSEQMTQLLLGADTNGVLSLDEDEFLSVIATLSQDYSSFVSLSPESSYFTAGKYTYNDYAIKVEKSLFRMNEALDYYNDNTIEPGEKLTVFKKFFSDSLGAMADIAQMHSETLDIMSTDAETILAFIDRMNEYIPSE